MSYYETTSILLKNVGTRFINNWDLGHSITTKANFRQLSIPIECECENYISTKLKSIYPDYYFLGEESFTEFPQDEEYIWVADPLDGTISYTHKIKSFAISLALLHEQEPIYAIIYAPFSGDLYWAEKDKGAFYGNKRISIAHRTEISETILSIGHGYYRNQFTKQLHNVIKSCLRIRTNDSSAIEMCHVANGSIDAYLNSDQKIYDCCAGAFIVSEAGGIVVDNNWKPLNRFEQLLIPTVIATTPLFLNTLKRVLMGH